MTLTRRPWQTVQDPESLVIATPRTLRHTTPLGSAGQAAAEIVCPRSARGLEAAYSLQQRIQALSGVQVAVVPAGTYPVSFVGERPLDRIAPPVAENGGQPARHKILLGNLSTNPDLAALYCAYLCPVDADFPGPGGQYLRTLCDPWGDGANRIVVGASSDDELLPAVEAFAARLVCDGDTVSVPYLHEARISPDFVSAYPETTFVPDDAYCAQVRERARQAYATRAHRAMTPYISHAAFMFQLTADERFAQLYLDLFQEMVEAVAHWEEDAWGPWGFDADFQSVPMVQGWHAIADTPVFTDEDRCHIASHLVAYLKNNEVHWENHRPKGNTLTRQNHFTFASLGLLYGAQTFGACYHLPDAARWLARADECFAPQLLAAKATEDCESYGWLTFAHTLRYALVRPVPSFFTDGACRALLDRGLANMDNFGYQVSYGDNASYTGSFSELAYWRPAAWVLGDLRYRELIERKEAVRPPHGPWGIEPIGYRFDLPPDPGEQQAMQPAKVTVLPIDPAYYQTHGGGPLPISEGFDKVAFRDSFNPDDPYLLLDGIANGSHGHRDANAIVRFTSQQRIWLEDADYDKVAANFHNTLIVTRDGESGVLPPYARLDTIVSASRIALAESTVLNVGGSDWTRAILWVRALGFVVVDRVVARQAGEFDLRCLWRTVGATALVDDQTWRITMAPASLNIVAAPPPAANWSAEEIEEPYVRVTWPSYPYAGPNVQVLRQGVTVPLAAGEECVLVSFLLDGDRPVTVRRDEQGWVRGRIGERAFRLWLGGQSLALDGAPAGLTARLLYDDQDDLVAVGLTGVTDSGSFSGVWERPEGALVAAQHLGHAPGADEAGWRDTFAALDRALAEQPTEEPAPATAAPHAAGVPATAQARELWRIEGLTRGPVAVADLDNDGSDEVLVGTSDGRLLAYRAGERLWAQRTPAAVTALGCGDVDGDGRLELIVGQAEGVVELRAADGASRWRQEFPPHMGHPATVRAAFTGKLDPAGPPAVLIATESCHVQAYTAAGQPLWRYEVVHAATTARAADVNGDGRDEVLAASEYWSWHGIQPDGTALFRVRGVESSGAAAVGTCIRPGTGQRLALFGGWDGHLTAYTPDGERAWDVPLGDIITTADGVDFDGRGQEEILVAVRSGYVYRYSADGGQRWRRNLGRAVTTARWLPAQRAIVAAAGNELVWLDPAGEVIECVALPARIVALHRWRDGNTEAAVAQDAASVLRAVAPAAR